MKNQFVVLAALGLLSSTAFAQGVPELTVSGTQVEAKIELASGVGADLTITFEEVVGLYSDGSSLGVSAEEIDPTDVDLLGRFPSGQLVSIPAAFPLMLSIEPPSTGPLTFSGIVSIGLHTHDLNYTANSPLRLYAASAGGPFHDITSTMGMGSYRTGGSKGGFSEFMIVADLRPTTTVIDDKFYRLQDILDDNCTEIDPTVMNALQAHLDTAWSWYASGDLVSAVRALGDLESEVKANSGAAIPSTWRSAGDLVNVAGNLRAQAATLRFSLNLASSS